MKQITKDTILIQGDERYNAIEIEQGIIWVDMNLRPQHGDLCITLIKQEIKPKIAGVIMPGDKIIAATFDLEGVPKIELEIEGFDEYEYTENDIRKAIEMAQETILIDLRSEEREHKYSIEEILQSLNSIKEIVVDENFKIFSYE